MGLGSDIFGSRPDVPGPIDYQDALSDVVRGNINLIPSLSDLATQSTDLYTNLLNRSAESLYPGTAQLKGDYLSRIRDFMAGRIPEDVSRELQRLGAERGAASGTAGSPFSKALEARDLGLTSLSLIKGGLSAAERWIAQAQSAPTFDFSRMFYGPQDAQRQAENEWQRRWLNAQVAAAPDPLARGIFDTSMEVLGMALSAYGGGAGYTGNYQQDFSGGGYFGSSNSGRSGMSGMQSQEQGGGGSGFGLGLLF